MRSRTLAILALAGTCGFPGSVTGETKDVRIATMPAPAGSPCGIKKKDRVAIYCATEWGHKAQEVKVEIEIGDQAECGKRSERTQMLDIAIVP